MLLVQDNIIYKPGSSV